MEIIWRWIKIKNKKRLVLIGIIIVVAMIYLFVPSVNEMVNNSVKVLGSLSLDGVVEYIRGFGVYAAVISFFLMVLQSIISPIPAFLITLANAAIFGWVKGAILSWTSSMVGAVMCFYIARILGRDVVEKFTTKTALEATDDFFTKYGKHTILICRLLPFISFDIVSYAAGLTSMTFVSFIIGTGLGQLPATIVYSYLGQLSGSAKTIMIALLLLFALSVLIFMIKKIYNEKSRKYNENTRR